MNNKISLPIYNATNPHVWFIQVDSFFDDHPNIDEITKYKLVKNQVVKNADLLPKYIQTEFLSVISAGFQDGGYKKLKDVLLSEKPKELDLNGTDIEGGIFASGKGYIKAKGITMSGPSSSTNNNRPQIRKVVVKTGEANIEVTDEIKIENNTLSSSVSNNNSKFKEENKKEKMEF